MLREQYCINTNKVYVSDFDKTSRTNYALFEMPHSTSEFKIPSIKIIDKLGSFGYEVKDNTQGIVRFKRYCDTTKLLKNLYEKFTNVYLENFPNAQIKTLNIKPKNPLPNGFKRYTFKDIKVLKYKLHKARGVFLAHFVTPKHTVKTIYFYFESEVFLYVFRAKKRLTRGNVLSKIDYERVLIPIQKSPNDPLEDLSNTLVAKFTVQKNRVLSRHQFKIKSLVSKGEIVQAYLKDENLVLQVEAVALKSGNKNDIIRIKTDEGKVLNAKVQSAKVVLIR